jgi:6-phosphogluconolactonase
MSANLTRREFVAVAGAGLLGSAMGATAQGMERPKRHYAFVSSWTKAMSQSFGFSMADKDSGAGGIHVFAVDMQDGSLTPLSSAAPEMNAGYICISPNGRFLYATDERKDWGGKPGGGGGLSAFSIDSADGSLTLLNSRASQGAFPAYIAIDATGTRVATPNHGSYDYAIKTVKRGAAMEMESVYDDGVVALFPVGAGGALGPASDVLVLEPGHGPGGFFQASPHPHSVNFDPSNRFLLACDKGADRIYVYRFDAASGALGQRQMFAAPPGTAPRHSAFHPRLPFVFIVNEIEASLSSYSFDNSTGKIALIGTVATVPDGVEARGMKNMPSDVRVHPNGKFVYGSTRGHNSIAVFRLDEITGRLSPVEFVSTGGAMPRGFNIEPSGRYLFVGNQESNSIVTFAVDVATGKLSRTGAKAEVDRPVCIKFAAL